MAYNRTLHHLISSQDVVSQWASGQSYVQNQLIVDSSKLYQCVTNHTSGATFAGDSAYWSGIEPAGLVDISAGGTGQTTATAAFDALAPTTTAGDIVVHNGTDNVRQGIGSDGQVLVVDTSQTNKLKWTNLQQGAKNYITYGTFENNATTGWSLSHSTIDATTKLPNQASGSWTAATSLAISAISSGQLAGSYSLQLSGTASTTAGDMLVTDALTLDLEAQSSVQTFSFFYKVTGNGTGTPNFSGTSSNAIGVAIYDVTNSAWIQPAGVFNIVQSSGVGKSSGTFQVPSNCTSVRLAVYFPNSTAASGGSPFTVVFDDFVLGPQVVQYGAPVTDWQSYTPTTQGFGTISSVLMLWRRVGDTIEIQGSFTAGTVTATQARLYLPSGAFDSSITQVTAAGEWYRSGNSNGENQNLLAFGGDNYFTFARGYTASGQFTNQNGSTIIATGEKIGVNAKVKIAGLSSSVQMSNDTDTRVVAASGFNVSSTTVTVTATATKITTFGTAVQDSHGAWSATNQEYTVPVSGYYNIFFSAYSDAVATNVQLSAFVYIGTQQIAEGTERNFYATASSCNPQVTVIRYLKAGDVISFKAAVNTGTAAVGSYTPTAFSISRLSGPATIAASESVNCKYGSASGYTLGNVDGAIFSAPTKIFDSHSAYNPATGYTVPVSGKYLVNLQFVTQSYVTASTIISRLQLNGTSFSSGTVIVPGGVTAQWTGNRIGLINANAGDIIKPVLYSNAGSPALTVYTFDNYIEIVRVGN